MSVFYDAMSVLGGSVVLDRCGGCFQENRTGL